METIRITEMEEKRPHVLVGKTIKEVQLYEDKQAIRFILMDGDVIATCYAECCSETWIENVELPALGFPAKVISAETLSLNKEPVEKESDWGNDYVQFYGFKIITDRGEIVIDYRNASNGYYYGELHWPGDCDYHPDNYHATLWKTLSVLK